VTDPTSAISARIKIERGEGSPTATIVGRLSGAFGLQLSTLLALAEQAGVRISRFDDQPVWKDPETGYTGARSPHATARSWNSWRWRCRLRRTFRIRRLRSYFKTSRSG
jgi:hypothetical protein